MEASSIITTPPRLFLLLENKRKSNNLGPEIRCATAFGIDTVVAVGFSKYADYGSHGASKHVRVIAFPTSNQAKRFLIEECFCESIVGLLGCVPGGFSSEGYSVVVAKDDDQQKLATVMSPADEVTATAMALNNSLSKDQEKQLLDRSFSVATCTFSRHNTAIAVGKQLGGLSYDLSRHCTRFVHVPHVAPTIHKEKSDKATLLAHPPLFLLRPPTFLAIALHHLTDQLGYNERTFEGHKFEVAQINRHRDEQFAMQQRMRRLEERKQQKLEVDAVLEAKDAENNKKVLDSLFAEKHDDDDDVEDY